MKKVSLLLIALSTTTAVKPIMEPVDTVIEQYQGYFDDSYDTCTANQWFWEKWFGPNCEPNKGTADQKTVEINQHVEKLTKQIKLRQDVELDTTREEKELADYNQLANCINDQKPATKKAVEFFAENQAALKKIEANGPESNADYLLLETATNLRLLSSEKFDLCLDAIEQVNTETGTCPDDIENINVQPYRHFFGNTQQLEEQKDAILEDHHLVKIQKEQIKKDAAQKKILAQQEEILAQARMIENARRLNTETATAQETEQQNIIIAEAKKINAAREALEKEKTREEITSKMQGLQKELDKLDSKNQTSFLGFTYEQWTPMLIGAGITAGIYVTYAILRDYLSAKRKNAKKLAATIKQEKAKSEPTNTNNKAQSESAVIAID